MPERGSAKRTAQWRKVAFGDVVRLNTERSSDPESDGFERYIGLEHIEPGNLRVRRWGDIDNGVTFTCVFRPGQVLFGKRRVYQRKVAVADFSGVCSSDIYVFEPKDQSMLPELLPFICQSDAFLNHAVETSAGSLSPRTNWRSLAAFEFKLPPVDEQHRIADALTEVEEYASAMDQLAEAASRLEESLGTEFFSEVISNAGCPLSDVAYEDITRTEVSATKQYRTVGVLNSGEGLFVKDELSGSNTKYSQLNVLRRHQLVMRKLTAWEGAIAVVPPEHEGAVVSAEFPTMTIRQNAMLPEFATWLVRQPLFWTEMKARSRGTALRRSRLHQRDLLSIRVKLPTLDEQRRIASALSDTRCASQIAKSRSRQTRSFLNLLREELLFGDATAATKLFVERS
jgi:type I restriction enzyme S subunit